MVISPLATVLCPVDYTLFLGGSVFTSTEWPLTFGWRLISSTQPMISSLRHNVQKLPRCLECPHLTGVRRGRKCAYETIKQKGFTSVLYGKLPLVQVEFLRLKRLGFAQLGPSLSSIGRGPLHKKSKTVLNWVSGSVIPLARITLLRLVPLNYLQST